MSGRASLHLHRFSTALNPPYTLRPMGSLCDLMEGNGEMLPLACRLVVVAAHFDPQIHLPNAPPWSWVLGGGRQALGNAARGSVVAIPGLSRSCV